MEQLLETNLRKIEQAICLIFPSCTFSYSVRFFKKDVAAQITMSADNHMKTFFYAEGNGPDLEAACDKLATRVKEIINEHEAAYLLSIENNNAKIAEHKSNIIKAKELFGFSRST